MNHTLASEMEQYTMKVVCDDYKTVYVDGKIMQLSSDDRTSWKRIATFDIPATTSVIGVKCEDLRGGHGIKVEVADKTGNVVLTSDVTWKCSREEQSTNSWAEDSFQENQSWGPAVVTTNHPNGEPFLKDVGGKVIWASDTTGAETVYCRFQLKGTAFCS